MTKQIFTTEDVLDFSILSHPKSQGIMALEAYTFGSTSISVESVLGRIKDRASKTVARAQGVVSKALTFLNEKKWWIVGALTIAAGFATAAVVLCKRTQQETEGKKDKKTLKVIFDGAKAKVDEMKEKAINEIHRRKADINNGAEEMSKKRAEAMNGLDALGVGEKKHLRYLRDGRAQDLRKERKLRDKATREKGEDQYGNKVKDTSAVKVFINKILGALKALLEMVKSAFKRTEKTAETAGKRASIEAVSTGDLVTGGTAALQLAIIIMMPAGWMSLSLVCMLTIVRLMYISTFTKPRKRRRNKKK